MLTAVVHVYSQLISSQLIYSPLGSISNDGIVDSPPVAVLLEGDVDVLICLFASQRFHRPIRRVS